SDPYFLCLIRILGQNLISTCEIRFFAPRLGQSKVQPRFDRQAARVHIMPIKRQASLQSQAVARAKADWFDLVMRAQSSSQCFDMLRRDADLEPVFAGIARTADAQFYAIPVESSGFHEV